MDNKNADTIDCTVKCVAAPLPAIPSPPPTFSVLNPPRAAVAPGGGMPQKKPEKYPDTFLRISPGLRDITKKNIPSFLLFCSSHETSAHSGTTEIFSPLDVVYLPPSFVHLGRKSSLLSAERMRHCAMSITSHRAVKGRSGYGGHSVFCGGFKTVRTGQASPRVLPSLRRPLSHPSPPPCPVCCCL